MKTFKFFAVAVSLIAASSVEAARTVYQANLVNEPGLAYNNTYPLDVTSYLIDSLSAVAVSSGASISSFTVTDGAKSTGSITVSSYTALRGTVGTNTLTVVSGKNPYLAAAAASDTINVASNTVTALNGSYINLNGQRLYYGIDWRIGASSSTTAQAIRDAINANTNFTATATGSTVTVSCGVSGTGCNAYTLASSTPAALAVASAKFTGGQNASYFNLNGILLTNGKEWSSSVFSSTNTAASIASAIGADSHLAALFNTSVSSNVVTVSCVSSGTLCNSYSLTSSTQAALAAGSATFTGGVNPAILRINGVALTEGADWSAVTSASDTAKSISTAINANSSLYTVITATYTAGGVVTTTSTAPGASTNYSLWTSTNAALRPFAPAMRGGSDSAFNLSTDKITKANHNLTLAFPVLYTTNSGTAPVPLVTGTTYYAIPIDASTFRLATTSTGAVAGLSINLTAQTGSGTFGFKPLATTATGGGKWQASNDGSNWFDLNVSSISVALSQSVTNWDFSTVNYQYYRWNAVAPSAGGWNLVIAVQGKANSNLYRP